MFKLVNKNTGWLAKNKYGYINSFSTKEAAETVCSIYNSKECVNVYKVESYF